MASSSRTTARDGVIPTLRDDDLNSTAQRDRRRRILDSTLALASRGGYDAVQMRAVADRADVAVGTLYRYFPSKVHLLVSALAREFERIDTKTDRRMPADLSTRERLELMIGQITTVMQRDPLLTEAMTRAFMFADASASAEVARVGELIDRIFARALTNSEHPTAYELNVSRVISDVWMSNLVAWLTRRATAVDVADRLTLTIRLLMGDRADAVDPAPSDAPAAPDASGSAGTA
ncbi:cholesterol catabolism transcriptional regulator KstR [Tomitella fengzijianii]|uniref:Cholesterol catabolism transcriptional regulator KstR n=1 Tax=Tomitella fengzijianii TaxID=2597660 RepID=A0A516X5B9_9ACTN|nr:cholesterol catabolism transcriptional regulator KstR [Tomitella fengzijianii]QDQ98240.1 cholesterol catabolism transcriptional regulator KstR [Tomitella fengzijianii]